MNRLFEHLAERLQVRGMPRSRRLDAVGKTLKRVLVVGGAAAAVAVFVAIDVTQSRSAAAPAPASQPASQSLGGSNQPGVLMMPPTPLPERLVATRPLGTDFVMLKHRSIFIHGQQTHDMDDGERRPEPTVMVRPESMLIFNGVARVNDQLQAFFEDGSSHQVVVRREGEALAQGHITHITLDSIDYDAGGHVTHVAIGQSLDGGTGASALANQPTGSSFSGSSSTDSGGGNDSVLERLRRRRQQEMGH